MGKWVVGGVGWWVDGWLGYMDGWVGGWVGGWAMGSHTSLDQPCLGTDMTGQGELNTPPPPNSTPPGSFVPFLCMYRVVH